MKKNKKINEIGKKLDIDLSKIKPNKFSNLFKKYLFWISNGMNFGLSNIISSIFGFIEINSPSFYPYNNIYNNTYGNAFLTVLSVNLVNGIVTIPSRKNFKLSRIMRIMIVIFNLILSVLTSYFIYYSIILSIPPAPNSLGVSILYNVYNNQQKKSEVSI